MIIRCYCPDFDVNLFNKEVISEDMNVLSGYMMMYSGMQYLIIMLPMRVSPISSDLAWYIGTVMK